MENKLRNALKELPNKGAIEFPLKARILLDDIEQIFVRHEINDGGYMAIGYPNTCAEMNDPYFGVLAK